MSARRSEVGPGAVRPDGRRRRWEQHRQARAAELVDATIRAVRRRGASVGMSEIAAEAGTSKTVIYRYFTSKTDLYLAVSRRVSDRLVAAITQALVGETEGRAMLAAGIDAYLRHIEAERDLYRFVVAHPLVDRAPRSDPVREYSAVLGALAARLIGERLRAAGWDDPGAAEPWGYGVVGLVRSAGEVWLERGTMSRAALTGYLTDLVWLGLAGAATAGKGGSAAPPGESGTLAERPDGEDKTTWPVRIR